MKTELSIQVRLWAIALVAMMQAACGGSGEPASISISPNAAPSIVEAGGSIELTVAAQNTGIIWPVYVPGSFEVDGQHVIYTPPPMAGLYDFTVAASTDAAKFATATVKVVIPPTPEITSFALGSLGSGEIDQTNSTITFFTHRWIDDPGSIVAEFSAVGEVTVAGVAQKSGSTANDFRSEVVYTVATGQYARRSYMVRLESPQTTGLPIVKVDTKNEASILSKEDYVKTNIEVIDPAHRDFNVAHLDYKDEIRGRGNSTWTYPKKPYRIKMNKKTSLFGLEAAKSWVLLANYLDPTLMMNSVTLELGQRFGLPYTNHYQHVELFLNGEYQGSYVLTEQVQAGAGRVEIDENTGYLVELDTNYDEEPKFTTVEYQLPVMIKSPEDLEDASGYDFVKDSLRELETAMTAPGFPDDYRDLVDMDSFVDFLLINEIVCNGEPGWPKSTYMYKPAGGKISMGPLWDFDWAFAYDPYVASGHQYFSYSAGMMWKHPFFARFFDDPVFVAKYKTRWIQMRDEVASMPDFMDHLALQLRHSQEQNFRKWPEARNNGYEREISDMKSWWATRVAYLDTAIAAMN